MSMHSSDDGACFVYCTEAPQDPTTMSLTHGWLEGMTLK